MNKQYIRTEEMKELLSLIPILRNIKLSLESEMTRCKNFVNDEDINIIEGMTFNNYKLSDIPHANTNVTSDKTCDIALNYEKEISKEIKETKKAISDIAREISYIEAVIEKMEIGLNAISKTQREILLLKYEQGHSWNEISSILERQKCYYSKTQIQRISKRAIAKLKTVARIDIEMYKKIKFLINKTNSE